MGEAIYFHMIHSRDVFRTLPENPKKLRLIHHKVVISFRSIPVSVPRVINTLVDKYTPCPSPHLGGMG